MDPRLFALGALLALAVYTRDSAAKPISLVERCWCRSTVNMVSPRSIRELKFVQTSNCPIQVIAKLKNSKEVCINPELKWLQHYVRNLVNKAKITKKEQQAI